MQNGTIARLTDKGYGFIAVEGQEKDLFFHAKSLVELYYDDLKEGDAVTFEIEEGEKGLSAINVARA